MRDEKQANELRAEQKKKHQTSIGVPHKGSIGLSFLCGAGGALSGSQSPTIKKLNQGIAIATALFITSKQVRMMFRQRIKREVIITAHHIFLLVFTIVLLFIYAKIEIKSNNNK